MILAQKLAGCFGSKVITPRPPIPYPGNNPGFNIRLMRNLLEMDTNSKSTDMTAVMFGAPYNESEYRDMQNVCAAFRIMPIYIVLVSTLLGEGQGYSNGEVFDFLNAYIWQDDAPPFPFEANNKLIPKNFSIFLPEEPDPLKKALKEINLIEDARAKYKWFP
jgi:hypothetical protein